MESTETIGEQVYVVSAGSGKVKAFSSDGVEDIVGRTMCGYETVDGEYLVEVLVGGS
jgi:hypothetical protein